MRSDSKSASDIESLLGGNKDLPPMPIVAQRVITLTDRDDTTPEDLQRLITTDPAITAKILKVANSALFGQSRAVSTVSHAAVLLGFSAIRSLVIAASLRSLYQNKGEAGARVRGLWEHALGCAIAAKVTAERLRVPGGEALFLGGLLHDIGQLVLWLRFGDEYSAVLDVLAAEPGRSTVEVEQELLGVDHVAVGGAVARHWQLTPQIERLIAHHESPELAPEDRDQATVVHIADRLCLRLGLGGRRDEALDIAAGPAAEHLGLRAEQIGGLEKAVMLAFESERRILE